MKRGKNSSFILEAIRELIKEAKCGWRRATHALMRDMKWGCHNKVGALHAETPPQCQNISEGCWNKISLISKVFRTEDITEMKSLRKALRARAILHRAAATKSLLMGGCESKAYTWVSISTAPTPVPGGQRLAARIICANEVTHTQRLRQPGHWAHDSSPGPLQPPDLLLPLPRQTIRKSLDVFSVQIKLKMMEIYLYFSYHHSIYFYKLLFWMLHCWRN